MARKLRLQYPGAIYHAVARGNARHRIFHILEDWEFFLKTLATRKEAMGFRLFGYCLMPNHIHLLIQPALVSLSAIMGSLLNRYARYINGRLERTGHVFQERFYSQACRDDNHLLASTRYIHLNPFRARLVADPADWPYSSHRRYLGLDDCELVDPAPVLAVLNEDLTKARGEYARFVREGMNDPRAAAASMRELSGFPVFGDNELIPRGIDTDRPDIDSLAAECAALGDLPLALLRSSTRLRTVCQLRRQFIRQACAKGYQLKAIAEYLGLTASAISQTINGRK
ncbi:MAG: hypothetical protein A2X36_16310 [Elusimicrobia bacterium GWA2_69_24]|nr:MAG: hypothetical protein A2X36_16310 [Elusimicrobia bacterium GWA2_69_24]